MRLRVGVWSYPRCLKLRILDTDFSDCSVDVKTEELMQRIIRTVFKNHTIIAVAHRLNTILDFDMVAVIEKGRLVEFGNPTDLLSRPRSAFRDMYESSRGDQEGELAEVRFIGPGSIERSKEADRLWYYLVILIGFDAVGQYGNTVNASSSTEGWPIRYLFCLVTASLMASICVVAVATSVSRSFETGLTPGSYRHN